MRPEFLRDGKFYRSAVVTEVRTRRLSRSEIKKLASDPEMQAEFFGDLTPYIRPKTEWDAPYLEMLSCAAGEECFNIEYLLYLRKVSDYVSQEKYQKLAIASIVIAIIAVVGTIIWMLIAG